MDDLPHAWSLAVLERSDVEWAELRAWADAPVTKQQRFSCLVLGELPEARV